MYLDYRLYFLANNNDIPSSLLNDKGELLSLNSLFEYFPKRTLAVSSGRSFGKLIDSQIANLANKNVFKRSGDGRYSAVGNMLLRHRIDYIIDFPVVINKELNLKNNPLALKSIAIANSPNYSLGHIACNKSPTGQKIIGKVNKILTSLYKNKPFYHAHARYIGGADLDAFNRYYQQVFHSTISQLNIPH